MHDMQVDLDMRSTFNFWLNNAEYWLIQANYYAETSTEPLDVVNAITAFDNACDHLFNGVLAQ
jgi:hypothetical protein